MNATHHCGLAELILWQESPQWADCSSLNVSMHVINDINLHTVYGKANEIISASRAALPLKNIVFQPENSIWGGGVHSCKRLSSTAAD